MKQAEKQGKNNKIGAIGEQIAVDYLIKKDFRILNTNYLKKWGEIDIVAHETGKYPQKVHFIEVKTVSYETKGDLERAVSYGTYKPEDNVHPQKLRRLHRTIESWLEENKFKGDWQIDVMGVRVVTREKYATVKLIPNIIFS